MGVWKLTIIQIKNGSNHQGKKEGQDGECCVEKRSTQKVLKEGRMKRSAKSRLRSADRDCRAPNLGWGAPTGIEERPY